MRFRPLITSCLACALALAFAVPAEAYTLKAPFDVAAVRSKVGASNTSTFTCGLVIAPPASMNFPSIYSTTDSSSSLINTTTQSTYDTMMAPVAAYEKYVVQTANLYVRSKPARATFAKCTLNWLYSWAKASALMGAASDNGIFVRGWVLASVANAWIQVRDEPTLDAVKAAKIASWLKTVANQTMLDFPDASTLVSRRNNHLYWAAWAVGMAGIAADDQTLFNWSVAKTRAGIDQIQQDGTLPLELGRLSRAYEYHIYAAMPLFYMAQAAYANGADLFSYNTSGLRRLGQLCLANLGTGSYFQQLTNYVQVLSGFGDSGDMGWVEVYAKHYGSSDAGVSSTLSALRPMKTTRMGGNLTMLYALKYMK